MKIRVLYCRKEREKKTEEREKRREKKVSGDTRARERETREREREREREKERDEGGRKLLSFLVEGADFRVNGRPRRERFAQQQTHE